MAGGAMKILRTYRAFSGEVTAGSPQKMRQYQRLWSVIRFKLNGSCARTIAAVTLTLGAAGAGAAVSTDVKMPFGADTDIGTINTDTGNPDTGDRGPPASDRGPLPGGRTLPAAAPRAVGRATEPNPLWAIPLKDLSETRDRPIFSPSRRPPPPAIVAAAYAPPPPAKPAEPPRPQLSLVGTIAGIRQGFGIFQDKIANKAVRLKIGEAHEGWILREVRAREIVFQKKDIVVTLALPAPEPDTVKTATEQPKLPLGH
jgi:hypothetical protein